MSKPKERWRKILEEYMESLYGRGDRDLGVGEDGLILGLTPEERSVYWLEAEEDLRELAVGVAERAFEAFLTVHVTSPGIGFDRCLFLQRKPDDVQ